MTGVDGGQRERRGGPSRFGGLLLGYRTAAGLTQEELAEASGISVRALRNLERGRAGGAQRRSVEALADALGLAGASRVEFVEAATAGRRRSADSVAAAPLSRGLCALPAPVADFVGRERELGRLRSWAREAVDAPGGSVVSIVGPAGIGKTALAVASAGQLAGEFPDGCLAVDLRGMDELPLSAGAALDRMLRALGVDPVQVPPSVVERSSLFRSMLVGRRVLVLLDNASDEAQARSLLATARGCLTMVTCRRALSGLEGARWLWLDPLTTARAVELVSSIVDPERVRAEPEAAAELVELCGNLPLAVRIAGNRLVRQPGWSLADLAGRLRDERARLSTLTAGDLRVRPAFAVSYERLSDMARLMFRRLALVPGVDFGIELAAVVADNEPSEAGKHLDELVDATLVQPAAVSGRYQFHDLIRIFARERLETDETAEQRDRAASAVCSHLLDTAVAAGRLFDPDAADDTDGGVAPGARERAADWLERESSNWLASARRAATVGRHRELVTLARSMHWFSDAHHQYPWVEFFGLARDAARVVGDRPAEAALLNFLGWAQAVDQGDAELRLATHGQALAIAVEIGDRREEAWALGYLGGVLMRLGRLDEALEHSQRSIDLFVELDYWPAFCPTRNLRGKVLRMLGRYDEAVAAHRTVLVDLAHRAGQMAPDVRQYHRAYTMSLIGEILLDLRDWPQAAVTFGQARALTDARKRPADAAEYAFHEGVARRRSGEPAAAAECLRFALTLLTEVPMYWWRARTLAELAATLGATGATAEAHELRQEALTLCRTLDTDQTRALAAELSSPAPPTMAGADRPAPAWQH